MPNKNKKLTILTWIFFSLSVAINLVILINACIPGEESAESSSLLANILAAIINAFKADTINSSNLTAFSSFVRKFIGHYSLFAVDAVFTFFMVHFYNLEKKKYQWWINLLVILLFGVFVATISECIQLVIPGRVGAISDVLIDSLGYLTGLAIMVLIYLFIYLTRLKKKPQQPQ